MLTNVRLPLRLHALGAVRWLKEYFISWGVLSAIYSVTAAVVVQPVLKQALGQEIQFFHAWISVALLLLLPGLLETLPLPHLPLPARGAPVSLRGAYLRHELRRGNTWLTLLLVVGMSAAMPLDRNTLWIFVAQLSVQRALYSVYRWRTLARIFRTRTAARDLLVSILLAQLVIYLISWVGFGALAGAAGKLELERWLRLGFVGAAGVAASVAVAMEGDAGRPWLVNFFALSMGVLGAFLCYWSPWFILLIAYVWHVSWNLVRDRIFSVEHMDEDVVIP